RRALGFGRRGRFAPARAGRSGDISLTPGFRKTTTFAHLIEEKLHDSELNSLGFKLVDRFR
ncbi:hypothetical protein, partial [Nitratireductor sp. GCM10026969]|uniref:hypothetical protein n=1 Tax=Nitratireductor sp. GCM10026969 TaxID=3252645 RepID=UPI003610CA44